MLLAGYAAGLAYGATLYRRGWPFAVAALLRRAGTLIYRAYLPVRGLHRPGRLFRRGAAEFRPSGMSSTSMPSGNSPIWPVGGAALCCESPAGSFLDILPLYIVLLLLLVSCGRAAAAALAAQLPMAASGAGYVLVRLLTPQPAELERRRLVLQPAGLPAAWSFTGCALGYTPLRGGRRGPAPAVPFDNAAHHRRGAGALALGTAAPLDRPLWRAAAGGNAGAGGAPADQHRQGYRAEHPSPPVPIWRWPICSATPFLRR